MRRCFGIYKTGIYYVLVRKLPVVHAQHIVFNRLMIHSLFYQ